MRRSGEKEEQMMAHVLSASSVIHKFEQVETQLGICLCTLCR